MLAELHALGVALRTSEAVPGDVIYQATIAPVGWLRLDPVTGRAVHTGNVGNTALDNPAGRPRYQDTQPGTPSGYRAIVDRALDTIRDLDVEGLSVDGFSLSVLGLFDLHFSIEKEQP